MACSPYVRDTYRYTPLLAVLLIPNEWLHPSFGKYLFATCDIIAGILLYRILIVVVLPTCTRDFDKAETKTDVGRQGCTSSPSGSADITQKATLLTATHLLNPMVFAISTRGSSEAVLLLFVLSTLYCALIRRWNLAAILLGLSTHWKVYPVIYGVACLGAVGTDYGYERHSFLRTTFNRRTVQFALISAVTFFAFGAAMYLL
jgi:GPI mannosyltransferase 1 subunit M